ncbi:MAG: response regulator transcription factor [Mariprofundaceae bacterium]|nr:response regulator transcription factor [Mariprofundaceae bacterium]
MANIYSVLLLEDETPTREYLSALIEVHPNLTLLCAASNCAQAKEALSHAKPDVLVADIGLPDGSGIDVIRAACKQYKHLEAMVITIHGDEEHVVQALEAGATGYLLKEQAFDELGSAILSLMAGETAISPKIARYLLKRFTSPLSSEKTFATKEESKKNVLKEQLTTRETEVLEYISRGYSYQEIADILHLSTNTIRAHIRNIYRKLAVKSRTEAVFEATQLGLISLHSNLR